MKKIVLLSFAVGGVVYALPSKPSFHKPKLHKISAPKLTVPKIGGPRPKVKVPKISVPKVSIPKISVPKVSIPKLSVPKVSIPKISVPKVSIPKISVPKVSIPKISVPKVSIPKIKIPNLNTKDLDAALKKHFGSDPTGLKRLDANLKSLALKLPKPALPHLGTVLKSVLPDPKKLKGLIDRLSKMGPKAAGDAVTELAKLEAELKRVEVALELSEKDPAQFKKTAHKLKGLISNTLVGLLLAQSRSVNITSVTFTRDLQSTIKGQFFVLDVAGTVGGRTFAIKTDVDPTKIDWKKLPEMISEKIVAQLGKAVHTKTVTQSSKIASKKSKKK